MDHYDGHMKQYLAENVNGRLVINLRDISHTMRFLYEGKGSQKRILMVLNDAGTITQRELTAELGIQPGSASEVIAKLERNGLVERALSSEDHRTADVSLTEEGKRQAEAALEQRIQRHEEMLSTLTQEEKEQLLALLEKVNADWQTRYGDQRKQHLGEHRSRHHGTDFESHTDHHRGHNHRRHGEADGSRGEQRHCDHDCANCAHPCGRFQNRQA